MAALKDRMKTDLTSAMRARDELRKATLRMVLAAVQKAEVEGTTARELSDDEVVTVLTREAKRRREAAEAFRSGGRAESAEREEAEAGVIAEYLPAALSDDELAALVDAAVAEADAESPRDMGKVMKLLQPKVLGRAEGSAVAAAVKARLTG
ncbi:MAG TPA: GatB/YqeY domain-containing protein [Jiangellaceae bacterium]